MIIWFSGTGNSRLVAYGLSKCLGDESLVRIDSHVTKEINASKDEAIVWVFPVYSWGVPPVVKDYIREVKLEGGKRHFMVCTCGDDCGLTYEMWRKLIRKRGWIAGGGFSVEMPNTYVSLPGFDVDSPAVARRKLNDSHKRIAEVARAVRVGSRIDTTVKGKFAWFKTKVIYPFFMRFLMSPKPFHHTDACVECGKCVRICPLENTKMDADGPAWGENCAGCLACYHVCPHNAVQYGNRTKGKGHYICPEKVYQG